jgi:hypothetical protein
MLKRIKVIVFSFVVISVLLLGAQIYINRILKKVIYEQISSFSKNNYQLKIEKINLRIISFSVSIQGIDLKHIPSNKDSIIPYANIKSSFIKLKRLNLFKLIFNQTLKLGEIELDNPKIDLFYNSRFTDTISTKTVLNLFTLQIQKLNLNKVQIHIYNLKKSQTFIKAENLNYNIRKLKLKIYNLELKQTTTDSSNLYFGINEGTVDGFYLNELLNKRTLNYSKIMFDKISLNISKNKTTVAQLNEKTEKIKAISQNRFFQSIKPVKINQIRFSMNNDAKNIAFQGNTIIYENRNFSMERFKLDIFQNFTTQIVSKELIIKGMDADSINNGYNIAVNSLELLEPKIKLTIQKKVDDKKMDASILSLFSIKRVSVLALNNGVIDISSKENNYMKGFAKNINVRAKNVITGDGLLFFDDATFKATDMILNMPNNLYNFRAAQIDYKQKTSNALITNFKLIPNYNKASFGKKIGKQVARVSLSIPQISIQNFNILDIINRQTFNCEKLSFNNLTAEFYKDKNIPLLATDYRKFPQELLRELSFGIKINTLEVLNGLIKVEILSNNADNSGTIVLDQINMLFKGVDNTATADKIQLTFAGRLAKIGLIQAKVWMPINNSLCQHTAHIEIGKMPFNYINKLINDVVHVNISKGQLDHAIIDLNGNKEWMNCKLSLKYHDLEMKILADESTSQNKNKLNLANKLANAIIINSNPMPGKSLRIAETRTRIQKNKFIINNWLFAAANSLLLTTAPSIINLLKRDLKKTN